MDPENHQTLLLQEGGGQPLSKTQVAYVGRLQQGHSGCRHGAPSSDGMEMISRYHVIMAFDAAYNSAIDELEARLNHPKHWKDHYHKYREVTSQARTDFWSQPSAAKYVDKTTYKLLLAMAAETILGEKYDFARHYYGLAIEMDRVIDLCNGDFSKLTLIEDTPEGESIRAIYKKARTDQGLKVALGKLLPCDCLPKVWVGTRLGRCGYCWKDFPKTELKKCGRCLDMDYCSSECSRKDWKQHKKICQPPVMEQVD